MTHNFTKNIFYSILFLFLLFSFKELSAQSLCTGEEGDPIVFEDFGSGALQYLDSTPASFGFSTTYKQKYLGEQTNDGMFSFQNHVNNDFGVWHTDVYDHTSPGTGYMMMVNADYLPGEFYRDTVDKLCVGSTYNFSVYLGNVYKRPGGGGAGLSLPNVRFEIRSVVDGTLLASAISGSLPMTPTTFVWNKYGLGFTSPSTSVVLLMVSDAPGGNGNDIAIDDIAFTPCEPATTAIQPIQPACNDGPADIKVQVSGNADYKFYQWQTSKDNGVTWTNLGTSVQQPAPTLNYTATLNIPKVSATDNNTVYRMIVGTSAASLSDLTSNCKAFVYSKTTLLKILDPVTITFPTIPPLCVNTPSVNLNTTTPAGGTFSGTPNITSAGTFTPSSPGNFKVIYKFVNSQGCSDTASHIIQVEDRRAADAGPDQEVCAGSPQITLNGKLVNTTTFTWIGAGTFSPNANTADASYIASAAEISVGKATVTLVNSDTAVCPPARDQVVIKFVSSPQIVFAAIPPLCAGGNSLQLSPTPSGGTFSGSGMVSASGLLSPSSAGTFAVTYKVAIGPSCDATISKPFTVIAPPTVNAGPDQQLCTDALTINLDGNSTNTNTIQWKGGMGTFSPDNTTLNAIYVPTQSEIDKGEVTLTLFNTDSLVCPSIKEAVIFTIEKAPVVNAGPDQVICAGIKEVQLQGKVTNAPGVSWSGGAGNFLPAIADVNARYQIVDADTKPGGPTITLTIASTGSLVCKAATDKMEIKVVPLPVVQIKDTGACKGTPILLSSRITNSTSVGGQTVVYEWQKDGQKLNDSQASFLIVSQAGNYIVQASVEGCSSKSTAKVVAFDFPVPFMPAFVNFCDEDTLGAPLDAGPGASYMWQPGGESNRKITVHAPGMYEVLVKNQHGCPLESQIEVKNICRPRLFISNSFSPNADTKNEYYNVYGKHFTNFKMYIFNRWGEVIFESNNRNSVWDGNYAGQQIPVGVYPWIITYEGDTEEYKGPYKQEGSVTVVR